LFASALFLVGALVGIGALLAGLPYYLTPLAERPFSPLHAVYAPTGLVGQGLGVVGAGMILTGVVLYSARKRVPALARVGKLKHWLDFHIFLCILGPFLVLLHTTFKFGGIVAIAFWSMTLVVASGVFGRWVYAWIPKTAHGRFLAIHETREQARAAIDVLGTHGGASVVEDLLGADPSRERAPGIASALGRSIRYHLGRRRARGAVRDRLALAGVPEPTRSTLVRQIDEQRRRQQQLTLLQPFQRAFRYWHAFHLPLAVVMLLVLAIHVGVSVAFGYTWIF